MTKRQGLRLAVFIVLLGIILNTMIGVFGFPPNDGTVSIKQRFRGSEKKTGCETCRGGYSRNSYGSFKTWRCPDA